MVLLVLTVQKGVIYGGLGRHFTLAAIFRGEYLLEVCYSDHLDRLDFAIDFLDSSIGLHNIFNLLSVV